MRPKVILKKNFQKRDYFKYERYKTFGCLHQNTINRLKSNGKKINKIRERRVLTYIRRKPGRIRQNIINMFENMLEAVPALPTIRIIKYGGDLADIIKKVSNNES